jgi:hypothetical protein
MESSESARFWGSIEPTERIMITEIRHLNDYPSMTFMGSATAVEKQLDQLETVVNTFVISSIIVLLASADARKDLEFLGMKVETASAYPVVAFIFDFAFLMVSHILWKIGDLFKLCNKAEADKAIAAIFTHKWMLNPFCYCGPGWVSVVNCTIGAASFVFSWWIGSASLVLLSSVASHGSSLDLTDRVLRDLYPVFGITSFLATGRLFRVLIKRADTSAVPWLVRSLAVKCIAVTAAAILGWSVYYSFAHVGA